MGKEKVGEEMLKIRKRFIKILTVLLKIVILILAVLDG